MKEHDMEHRGYYIKPHKDYPMQYLISTVGIGGKIPDVMHGMFTSSGIAKDVIDYYLATRPSKEESNDKKGNKS